MREASPDPMLSTYATRSFTASMSRKSSFSAPGIESVCQVSPPSAVRMMVPVAPLAQATLIGHGTDAPQPSRDAALLFGPLWRRLNDSKRAGDRSNQASSVVMG